MEDAIVQESIIDPDLDSYKSFFDHEWCERTFESVEKSPLKGPVDDLMFSWRSTAGAHRLPWLMVEQLRASWQGELKATLEFGSGYSQRMIQGLSQFLQARIPSLDSDQCKALWNAVTEKEQEAARALETARADVQSVATRYWGQITGQRDFGFSLLGLQPLCYAALFFAYEDFLVSTIKAKKDKDYSSKRRDVGKDFAAHFGDSLANDCWYDAEVELARLVRHAVAHNSGRFGMDLEKYKARFFDAPRDRPTELRGERFVLIAGRIKITPRNTSYLFGVLKERVTKVIAAAK